MRSLQNVGDVNCVLPMQQMKAFLELCVAKRKGPDRQAGTEAELGEVVCAMQFSFAGDGLVAAERGLKIESSRPARATVEDAFVSMVRHEAREAA